MAFNLPQAEARLGVLTAGVGCEMIHGMKLVVPLLGLLVGCGCGGGGGGAVGDGGPGGGDGGGGIDAGAEPGAEYVFDETVLRTYELTVAAADWQWLNDNAQAERYVPAMLVETGTQGGAAIGPIGVRYKGGYGTLNLCFDGAGNRTCPKLSLKLKFDEYVDGLRFHGLKRLNFHSMRWDPSQLHDRVSYWLFRQSGVIAPRAVHARIVVNGELLGLFALIEEIDGVFTQDRFADGGHGNLYKEVWPVWATEQPYLEALEQSDMAIPSAARMVRFAGDLAGATDATFRGVLEAWTDVPALMKYLAVDRLIDHWDGIVGWYCPPGGGACFNHNYYWYEELAADRVWLIPWDMDNTLQVPSPLRSMYGMPDWNAPPTDCAPIPVFLGIAGRPPACDALLGHLATVTWDDYAVATRALLAGPARLDLLQARVDEIATQIAGAVAEDPNGPGAQMWQQAVNELKNELPALRNRVSTQVGP